MNFKIILFMNLYKLTFSHHAPKGSEEGIKGYLTANNDKEVFDFIMNSKDERGFSNFHVGWEDEDFGEGEEHEGYPVYDDKWNEIANYKTKPEFIMHIKGDINDGNYDFSDSYYGITRMGWELVDENVTDEQIAVLNSFNILYKV